jgi:hypothetical protein
MILPVAQVTARRIAKYRMGSSAIASQSMRFYAQPSKRGPALQQEPQRRRSGGRATSATVLPLSVSATRPRRTAVANRPAYPLPGTID